MNCIIANTNYCSQESIRAYLHDDAWQVHAVAHADALQHTLQQCTEGIMLYYIPFCNTDAAMLKSISKKYPGLQVIAFVESRDVYSLRQCIHEKVAVWMSSSATLAEISAAMHAVAHGRHYHCNVIDGLMERYCIKPRCKSLFGKKELELLNYIGQNHTTDEIARLLYSSPDTIYDIRKRLMKKTGARNMAALLWYAIERGYLHYQSSKQRYYC